MIGWILGIGFVLAVIDWFTGKNMARMPTKDLFSLFFGLALIVWVIHYFVTK